MAIEDDFSVAVNGDIRYTGTTDTYTVLELHRFLQDLADNASTSSDDLLDITGETPSDRSTDNIITLNSPYNIDDTAAQFLYDGSITQDGGDTIYAGLVVVGSVNLATNLILIQNDGLLTDTWSTEPNADAGANILLQAMVKVRESGADIDGQRLIVMAREYGDTYAEFSLTMGLGNSTAAIFTSDDLNNDTASGTVALYTPTITTGYQLIDIEGDGDSSDEPYYIQFEPDQASDGTLRTYEYAKYIQRRGTAEDLYTSGIQGELLRGITHEWSFDNESTGVTDGDRVVWGFAMDYDNVSNGSFAIGDPVQVGTSIGRILATTELAGSGTIVVAFEQNDTPPVDDDNIDVLNSTVNAQVNGAPTGGLTTGGGEGFVLAENGADQVWIQLTKGTAPSDNVVIRQRTDPNNTHQVNGTVTSRTVSPEFIGTFTGSAIIGAFGIGWDPAFTSSSDLFTDLDGDTIQPPNNVTFTVSNLDGAGVGEDRVLVGPEDGAGGLDLDQLAVDATVSGAAVTSFVVDAPIPSDTPASGTIRVQRNSGVYSRIAYSSYSGQTFTITSTDFSGDNADAGNNVFVSYIDTTATGSEENVTVVFDSPRTLFIRVRNGGSVPIKTFETTASLGSGGGSATTIRTADS